MKRVVFAYFVSPVIVMLCLAVVARYGFGEKEGASLAAVLLIMGIPIAYLSGALIGIPMLFIFARKSWTAARHLAFVGACATAPYASLFFFQPMPHGAVGALIVAVSLCLVGAATAVLFWYFGTRGNERLTRSSTQTPANAG